jgi:methionine synthase II (cobalamin-independent)
VKATRDFDRKRIEENALNTFLENDRAALKKMQEGFSIHSSGLFHWDDLMRPFVELINNCQAGSLTRFFETNTFWRRLEVHGNFSLKEDQLEVWFQKYFFPENHYSRDDPVVFTFPFLFLFREFSHGVTLQEIQILLQRIVVEIEKKYKGYVVFFEPHIGWKALNDEEKKAARKFLENIKSNSKVPVALMQCFYPVEKEREFLFSLPVDSIGIDFYCNRLKDIAKHFPKGKSLLAGVMSTESTLLESKEHIQKFLSEAKKILPEENIFITTSGPAELLPREIMDKKLQHMKETISWS